MTAPAHVIIVSYYFPPLGLAGTARPVMLANLLAGRGHRVVVVTVKPINYPIYDDSLLARLDGRVAVQRVESLDPARLSRYLPMIPKAWLARWKSRAAGASKLFPDSKTGFVPFAVRAVEQAMPFPANTVVITTSPPVSSHLVGLYVRRSAPIKWIADFRDIWTSLPAESDSIETGRRAAELTREIAGLADAVTSTSPETRQFLLSLLLGEKKPVQFVPNGYDERDFTDAITRQPLSLGLYGTLNHLIGFDRLARFVAQLRRSTDSDWRIRHVGHVDLPELPSILTAHRLENAFESTGYAPHPRSLALIRRSAVNLIALSDQYDTRYIVPSKLFELLRAEPPLLAMLPRNNAARHFLAEREFPRVAFADGSGQFVEAIEDFVAAEAKDPEPPPRPGVEQFEWQRTLAPFADLVEGLLA